MSSPKAPPRRPIILPAEIRVREFDAKLLLACCLAERGARVFVGQRTEIDLMAWRFPRSIYVAKGLTQQTRRHLESARRFGHEIVAWDEEAVCYYTREHYQARRIGPSTVPLLSHLIAWGDDNAEVWAEAAEQHGIPIHVLGNPRSDLLRRELRALLEPEAEKLRSRHGRFILINSNFGSANNLIPKRTRYVEGRDPAKLRSSDRIGYLEDIAQWRLDMFRCMREVPAYLARNFPDTKVVIRPHPAENHAAWHEAAEGLPNVEVIHEGGVLPWILASACVVHSSCTTGLEAYLLDKPAVAVRHPGRAACDNDLPNLISYSAWEKDEMQSPIAAAIAGELPPNRDEGRSDATISRYLASMNGALASDNIAEFLADLSAQPAPPAPGLNERLAQRAKVNWRSVWRLLNSWRADHPANPAWREHQFAMLDAPEVNAMIADYARILNRFTGVTARRIGARVFEVTGADRAGT